MFDASRQGVGRIGRLRLTSNSAKNLALGAVISKRFAIVQSVALDLFRMTLGTTKQRKLRREIDRLGRKSRALWYFSSGRDSKLETKK